MLRIEQHASAAIPADLWASIIACCEAAYQEPFEPIFAEIEPEQHLIALEEDRVVGHLCWAERELQAAGLALRTAYIEAFCTHPDWQGRGLGTGLLRLGVEQVVGFQMAALSPSDPAFYAPRGWELWQGPLSVRTGGGEEPTPDEEVMIHRLPETPALDLAAALSCEWRPGEIW